MDQLFGLQHRSRTDPMIPKIEKLIVITKFLSKKVIILSDFT